MKKTKILIIRFSAIGDIVWTSPVIRALKQQIPDIELHYCTKLQYKEMLASNPYIDKLFYLKENLWHLIKELKAEKYDMVVDLHKNLRTTFIKMNLWAKVYTYHKFTLNRWLFTKFKLKIMPEIHVADRYMLAVKDLKVLPDEKGLDYFIAPEDEIAISLLPASHQKGYIAFVIGASEFTKRLPLDKLIELCAKISKPIVIVGGKEDFETGEKIKVYFDQNEEGKTVIFNACGKYGISQSASLVKQADLVFGHDTGLTHIAAAFKKKIYAIYGGTSPLGFSPYQTEFALIENKGLKCRPCSKSGRDNCPRGHFKCMKELKFDTIHIKN